MCLDHLWTWFFGRRWTIWFRHTWLIYSYAHLISNRFVRKIRDHIGRKTSSIRSQSHLRSVTLTIIYGFLFGWMFFWINIKCKLALFLVMSIIFFSTNFRFKTQFLSESKYFLNHLVVPILLIVISVNNFLSMLRQCGGNYWR